MALITDKADLVFSTQARSGTPDGNIFLDVSDPANPRVELIDATELTQIDYGSGLEANRLDRADGVTMQAIYGAIGVERKDNETIRQYRKPGRGRFADAGAYDFLNNWQFATTHPTLSGDIKLVRSSGLRYLNTAGAVTNIFFGPKSLGNIVASSQPYFQTADQGASTDFEFTGDLDELVQVYRDDNGDGTPDEDLRAFFAVSVRTFGQVHDRKSLVDSGLARAADFSGGFGLAESPHPSTGDYDEAVINLGAVSPWDTLNYLTEAAPVSRTGFNEADANFAESIENASGAPLNDVLAFMDALARRTTDIDSGTPSQVGKDVDTLYTFDSAQNVILKQGLFIENLPGSDLTRLRLTADNGDPKTFPQLITVTVALSAVAQGESTAWYHAFIENDEDTANDYNTANALTLQDKDGVEIKGTVGAQTEISFDLNFSAVPGGTTWEAGDPYVIRFIVGDDPDAAGGPVENFVLITIDGTLNSISVEVSNDTEENV